jgi:hypothetical protein
VSEQPRRDREWDHWPGRKGPDDRIRHRLKALFVPTDGEDAVEALIIERGREIEERTEQLHATITDLERREEQTGRLRSAVEEMLRHGSAELDERHSELAALALELGTREEQVRAAERDVAVRKQELGAVELRSAAVERRAHAATEREEKLIQISDELTSRELHLAEAERNLADQRGEIDNLQRAIATSQASLLERERSIGNEDNRLGALATDLAEHERRIEAEQASITEGREELARAVANISTGLRLPAAAGLSGTTPATHVLYLAHDGYRLIEADGRAPAVDTVVDIDGHDFVVTRVGRSPLPGDLRECAYVEPARAPRQA